VNGFEGAAGAAAARGDGCWTGLGAGDPKGELAAPAFEAVGELCGAGAAFGFEPNGDNVGGSGGGVGALARLSGSGGGVGTLT
jgi:hypothetical protein